MVADNRPEMPASPAKPEPVVEKPFDEDEARRLMDIEQRWARMWADDAALSDAVKASRNTLFYGQTFRTLMGWSD